MFKGCIKAPWGESAGDLFTLAKLGGDAMHAWSMARHARSCVRLNGRFATLFFAPLSRLQCCHAELLAFLSHSVPSAEGCTMKTRTCRTWRRLSTSEASAWRRSSSATLTAQNMSCFWMEEVKKRKERSQGGHGFHSKRFCAIFLI